MGSNEDGVRVASGEAAEAEGAAGVERVQAVKDYAAESAKNVAAREAGRG